MHRDLVCPVNLALMENFIAGLNVASVSVVCLPVEDGCCVSFRFDS